MLTWRNFPPLAQTGREESRERNSGPQLAIPRAKRAKRWKAARPSLRSWADSRTLRRRLSRVRACVAAVSSKRQELKYFEGEEGRARALKVGKTLRAKCAMHISND
eukprot:7147180-Alexandrium_andersonii.AAC.1